MHGGKSASLVAVAIIGILAFAPAAQANHHLMRIAEIYPGTALNPDSAYVELQMFAAGQNVTSGQSIRTYDAAGAEIHSFAMPSNVANGQNQRTVLVGGSPSNAVSADFTDTGLGTNLVPTAGAVCFTSTTFGPVDCASWGAFTGNASLPSGAGAPAPAITDGSALRRDISGGCSTALEATDDSNVSADDFFLIGADELSPTPNAVTPGTDLCAKPNTKLTKRPKPKTTDRTPKLKFKSSPPGAILQCKLDNGHFSRCVSPFTTRKLSFGKHTFEVRAKNANGKDPSPAKAVFRVIKKP